MSLHDSSSNPPAWVLTQKKTFTGWCNNYLINVQKKINDLSTDLHDGVLLINLLEQISNNTIKHNAKPRLRVQEIENCSKALDFMKSEGIKLVSIGPEDVCDGKLKLILGMLWTLILRYEINRSGGSVKNDLLDWIRLRVAPYNLHVGNFKDDWANGKLISALVDSFIPGSLKIEGEPHQLAKTAMTFAEKELKIPMILDPNDMINAPDDLSIITYLFFYKKLEESVNIGDEIIQFVGDYKFVLFGQGLKEGKCGYEKAINITITDKKTEKPALITTDQIKVNIIGPEKVTCSVNEGKAGEIKCYYKVLNEPGDYTVEINFSGQLVDKVVVPWSPPDNIVPIIAIPPPLAPPVSTVFPVEEPPVMLEVVEPLPLPPVITLPEETDVGDLPLPSPTNTPSFPPDLTPTPAPDLEDSTEPNVGVKDQQDRDQVQYTPVEFHILDTPEQFQEFHILDTPEQVKEFHILDTPEQFQEFHILDTPEQVKEFHILDTPDILDTPEQVKEFHIIETPEPAKETQILDTPEQAKESQILDTPEPAKETQILDTPEPAKYTPELFVPSQPVRTKSISEVEGVSLDDSDTSPLYKENNLGKSCCRCSLFSAVIGTVSFISFMALTLGFVYLIFWILYVPIFLIPTTCTITGYQLDISSCGKGSEHCYISCQYLYFLEGSNISYSFWIKNPLDGSFNIDNSSFCTIGMNYSCWYDPSYPNGTISWSSVETSSSITANSDLVILILLFVVSGVLFIVTVIASRYKDEINQLKICSREEDDLYSLL